MSKAKTPVAVDGIEFDALMDQTNDYAADIPDYPVEDGYNVQDTIILQPQILSLTLFLSNTPVTWRTRFGLQINRVDSVLEQLNTSYKKRNLVTIVTTDKTYKNMGIESYSVRKSPDVGYAREITMRLKEVVKTATKKVSIPESYGKSGATGVGAGNAGISSSGVGTGSSASSASSGSSGSDSSMAWSFLYG